MVSVPPMFHSWGYAHLERYRHVQLNIPLNWCVLCAQGELAIKNVELGAATREAEVLLREISENTMIAEKEKTRVAVIVDSVTQKAQVRIIIIANVILTSSCEQIRAAIEAPILEHILFQDISHVRSASDMTQVTIYVICREIVITAAQHSYALPLYTRTWQSAATMLHRLPLVLHISIVTGKHLRVLQHRKLRQSKTTRRRIWRQPSRRWMRLWRRSRASHPRISPL